MIMPDVLIVENYKTMNRLGILDSIPAIALPYVASAFGIFLLRQTFKTVPKELDEAARIEGAGPVQTLLKVYVPLAKPVYLAYGLVSVSYHWNNFLWPFLAVTTEDKMNVTVGVTQVYDAFGVHYARDLATAILGGLPVAVVYLIFQRRVTQAIMLSAGIKG